MADPSSVNASVIAIATAAAQISSAISKLRHIAELPARVYALKNERYLDPNDGREPLKPILERTRDSLADLARALQRIEDKCTGSKIKIITRSTVWLKEERLFQGFRNDIRSIQASLTLMLGATHALNLNHIHLELQQVSVLPTALGKPQDYINQNINAQQFALSTLIDQQHHDMNDRFDALNKLILEGRPRQSDSRNETGRFYEKEVAQDVRVVASPRIRCRNWCPCACHAERKLKLTTPGVMECLLGKMFVGYTGLPAISKPCNLSRCRDRQNATTTIEYWFPSWFISRNLRLHLMYLPQNGMQFQLSTTRRIPDDSQSITYAMQGNMEGLKLLFTQGLADPRDVSNSRGFTLIRWALYGGMHNHETVQFLINQGAHVDDISHDNVWDFILRGKCNDGERDALRCITEGGEGHWVEKQNFPLVHRIIFGQFAKSLATELEEHLEALDAKDTQRRTALDWAVARAQLEDVNTLLEYGADPNNMDITGRTPVLHAVDSHNAACLRLILEGGGDPNPRMPSGVFRSSPLTAAGFAGMPDMLKLLLDFEANPNACNPEGLTALHSVARTQNVECALLILDYGADLNAMSSTGRTPLTTSLFTITTQSYGSLLIVATSPQLLPIIAEHANVDTINILASAQSLKVSYDLSINSISTSREILQQRPDYNTRLSEAFEELIAIAKAETSSADPLIVSWS